MEQKKIFKGIVIINQNRIVVVVVDIGKMVVMSLYCFYFVVLSSSSQRPSLQF